jgi:hypothetical protein
MHALLIFAAEGAADHGSKTAFYVAGLVLAGWAVLVGGIGVAQPAFARGEGTGRVVIGVTALLVAAAMAAAIITSS